MVKHISYPTVQIDSNSTVFASTTLYRDKPFVSTSNNVPDLYSVIRQIKRFLLRQIKTGFTEHLTMV